MAAAVALTLLLWVCFTNLYVVQPAHVIKASPALPPFKHSFHRMGPMGRSCSDHAASQAVDAAAATVLKPRSRDLPKSDAGAPVLVASNWDGAANRSHAGVCAEHSSSMDLTKSCLADAILEVVCQYVPSTAILCLSASITTVQQQAASSKTQLQRHNC